MSINERKTTKLDSKSPFTRTIIDINELKNFLIKGANHGVCGGRNLGNTCFMNSSIACLSNCTELTTYFLSGKYKQNINKRNKLGLGGKLAKAWHDLLEEYWNSGEHTGNPSHVKSVVAKKIKKFSGFNQQDSNEFMTEFLYLLSEDLNKTEKKSYKELKEKSPNESELECAKRFWEIHIRRNDSIITDLFSGLLKSEVVCSQCRYNNITFDPFNTLTLAIPPRRYMYDKKNIHRDIIIFYIPKYSIRESCEITIHVKKDTPFKDFPEEINKIKNFKYNLKKLIFIKVLGCQFKGIIDGNECKYDKNDFIFSFDDERIKGENTNIIPLYMYNTKKISAFPRLLFLKENSNFGELKKKIYYFARKYFVSPFINSREQNDNKSFKGKEIYEVDKEIEKYRGKDNDENEGKSKNQDEYEERKLWNLFEKEYNKIFNQNPESKLQKKIEDFFDDFPYRITIKKQFGDKEHIILFDGKNNLENLKEFNISKDEDSINSLIENKDYCINLILKSRSKYSVESIDLNGCQTFKGENVGKKFEFNYTLDDLFEYFCSHEYLEKGNEWKCGNCNKKVNVTKKLSIYYVPRLMIICLNRFVSSGYGFSKNEENIDFPLENLNMGKYICGPDKDRYKYDLFAVSQHYGSTGGGHYTAVCKNYDGKWYNYDDSSVSISSSKSVVSSAAYVLFYRRKNW